VGLSQLHQRGGSHLEGFDLKHPLGNEGPAPPL
jgi:hypothetical protein